MLLYLIFQLLIKTESKHLVSIWKWASFPALPFSHMSKATVWMKSVFRAGKHEIHLLWKTYLSASGILSTDLQLIDLIFLGKSTWIPTHAEVFLGTGRTCPLIIAKGRLNVGNAHGNSQDGQQDTLLCSQPFTKWHQARGNLISWLLFSSVNHFSPKHEAKVMAVFQQVWRPEPVNSQSRWQP